MLKKILFALLCGVLAPSAYAGSAQAHLKCVSASGKTLVEAQIPGDSDETRVTLTLDAKSPQPTVVHFLNQIMIENLSLNGQDPAIEFPDFKKAIVATVNPEKIKTLTITVMSPEGFNQTWLTLVAKPETIQMKRKSSWSTQGTFSAVLNGVDPRKEGFLSEIAISCSYNYSI